MSKLELYDLAKGGLYSNNKKLQIKKVTSLVLENSKISIPMLMTDLTNLSIKHPDIAQWVIYSILGSEYNGKTVTFTQFLNIKTTFNGK